MTSDQTAASTAWCGNLSAGLGAFFVLAREWPSKAASKAHEERPFAAGWKAAIGAPALPGREVFSPSVSWRMPVVARKGCAMGQVLHGSAKTTHVVRAELQRSEAPAAELARRYGLDEKTVRKWRSRPSVEDAPMGPKERRSSVLSAIEEAAIVALRVEARLPLDDVFIA